MATREDGYHWWRSNPASNWEIVQLSAGTVSINDKWSGGEQQLYGDFPQHQWGDQIPYPADVDIQIFSQIIPTQDNTEWVSAVAYKGGSIIGMGHLSLFDMSSPSLSNLYVDPQHRRQGIATRLVESLCNYAMAWNRYSVRLFVRPSNQPAIELYRKRGFSFTHIDKDGDAWYRLALWENPPEGVIADDTARMH